jgi:hypothetical protein
MPSYRYCFLDSADSIAEFHVIASGTDGEARTRADRLLAACDHPGIEVWDGGRHVYRVRKTDSSRNDDSTAMDNEYRRASEPKL